MDVKSSRPWLHAHRGASFDRPENTLAAFQLGLEQGADGIEVDVHASSDGVPMVIHDADLSRTTDRIGLVTALTAAEIGQADAGAAWGTAPNGVNRVPRLADVIEILPVGRGLVIDVKDPRAVAAIIDLLEHRPDASHSVRLISFLPEAISAARQIAPWLYTGLLLDVGDGLEAGMEAAASRGHQAVVPFEADLGEGDASRAIVRAASSRGLEVGTWVVNERTRAEHLRSAGVAFLMSDVPARLV